MTIRILVTAVGIALLLANPAWTQSTTTTTTASTTTTTGSFDSLSPGNQKIANALFSAQKTTGTTKPLTKNQIADLKGTEGWGRVFKTLKADGLVSAKNLGQVVSGYQHSLRSSTTSTASRGTSSRGTSTTTAGATGRSGGRVSSAGITNGRGFSGSPATGGGFGHGGMGGGGFGGGVGGGGFGGAGHGGGGGGGHGR